MLPFRRPRRKTASLPEDRPGRLQVGRFGEEPGFLHPDQHGAHLAKGPEVRRSASPYRRYCVLGRVRVNVVQDVSQDAFHDRVDRGSEPALPPDGLLDEALVLPGRPLRALALLVLRFCPFPPLVLVADEEDLLPAADDEVVDRPKQLPEAHAAPLHVVYDEKGLGSDDEVHGVQRRHLEVDTRLLLQLPDLLPEERHTRVLGELDERVPPAPLPAGRAPYGVFRDEASLDRPAELR